MAKYKIGHWPIRLADGPRLHEGHLKSMIRLRKKRRKIARASRQRNRRG